MPSRLQPAIVVILAALTAPVGAQLPVNDAPLTEKWAPAKWGADDKVGSPNRTTPQLVLKAVGLVKQGKGRHARQDLRLRRPGFRHAEPKLVIPGKPTGVPSAIRRWSTTMSW